MQKLTAMQQKIYDYIANTVRNQGYPPSVREIGEAVGLKSPSTVHFHIKHLEELGYIASYWGDSGAGARRRYYTITSAGREACHRLLGEWQETKEIMDKLLEVEEKL